MVLITIKLQTINWLETFKSKDTLEAIIPARC